MIDLFQSAISFFQAIFNCIFGEGFIMLYSGKSLLLSGGNNLIVTNQCSGTVVIKCGYSENFNSKQLWF
jgi:hypothetical protein